MEEEKQTITPPQLSRRWGTNTQKVGDLISSGQLEAINLAVDPDGKPRYRIYLTEVERFEQSRSTKPEPEPPEPTPRRRRRATAPSKDYFS